MGGIIEPCSLLCSDQSNVILTEINLGEIGGKRTFPRFTRKGEGRVTEIER
jgi:hypothetical protein